MVVSLEGITKKYNSQLVLDGINLELHKGEITALIGKNGAGKTTLMKVISSLIQPTKGNLKWKDACGGKNVSNMIASPIFFNDLTGFENIEYFRILKKIDNKEVVNDVLKKVDLIKEKDKHFGEYSLGMKQRLGIALCLLNRSKLLILDEPTNGIDPEGVIEITEILNGLNTLHDVSILISSHSLIELVEIAERFIFLHDGRIKKDILKSDMLEEMQGRKINEYFSYVIRGENSELF